MIRIGLTGNIGAGKTTVGRIFQSLGARFIDADQIGHKILSQKKVKRELIKSFGKDILTRKGEINRKRLAEKVFRVKKNQKILNRITHPVIKREIMRQTKGEGIAVIEATLLFESSLGEKMDYTIWVSAPRQLKLKRAKGKYPDAEKRLSCQLKEKEGKKRADFVIKNEKNISILKRKVRCLWQEIRKSTQSPPLPPDTQKTSSSL